jgi:aminoglycoside phosphotransferase
MAGFVPPVDNTATQHDGTESLAVNDNFVRRFLTVLGLNTIGRIYRYHGSCIPISKNLMLKTGPWVHLTEAATMRFVASKTSVPVPRVHCAFVRNNQAIIVMDRIRGTSLSRAWKTLSEADRDAICEQLRTMLRELRSLPPPPDAGIESCVGGTLRDARITRSRPRFGPFKTAQEFHRWLRHEFQPGEHPENSEDHDWEEIRDMVEKQDGPWPPPVFTHGDLNPSNIMVRDGRVVAIIDWEYSGWYPPYWEYTSTWYGHLVRQGWEEIIPKFLDPYPEELKMEITRQRCWGDL